MTPGVSSLREMVLVSPYFPPSTLAGVHRARHLAKHLPAWGWKPIVLCVDEAFHEQRLDPQLAQLVPGDVEVVKTTALGARWARPFGFGDISLRAQRPLRRALAQIVADRAPPVVMITGGPFYAMLLAPELKRRFATRIVLDFQDPWASDWGARQPGWSKAGLSHRLARALEPRVLRAADAVTSVSPIHNSMLACAYPWLDSARMADIPIGCDPDDFIALRRQAPLADDDLLDAAYVNFSFVGAAMPRTAPLLTTLFRAFGRLRAAAPELAARIRLNFIGTSNQPGAAPDAFLVRPLAEAEGIGAFVRETPDRSPYLAALSVMARSHALLLIGSDEPHYTASKIYPALMSGRPYLSLFHGASSAHDILRAAGGGIAHAFETPQQLAALEPALASALTVLATRPGSVGVADARICAAYEARAIAGRFAAVFDSVSTGA